jgi:hypothetical protein
MKQTKRNSLLLLLIVSSTLGLTQEASNETLKFTKDMELKIAPSSTSSQNDFDFLVGKWKVHNRKLKVRLNHSNEWDEFDSELHMEKSFFERVRYWTFIHHHPIRVHPKRLSFIRRTLLKERKFR